MLEARLSVSIV